MNENITISNNLSTEFLLKEASNHALLSIEQEEELARRIKMGDEEALQQLVNGNLRFVVSIARQYQDRGQSLEELIEAGKKGLKIAARKFEPERGFKFISYAVWWIRASVLASLCITDSNKEPSELTDEEKREIVDRLTNEHEKAILTRWLGLDSSHAPLEENGHGKTLTAERVSQIRERAIRKLSSEQSPK